MCRHLTDWASGEQENNFVVVRGELGSILKVILQVVTRKKSSVESV